MRTATLPVSSVCWLVAAFVLLACLDAHGQATNTAKKVLHADGTVTESVSDSAKGELRESTFDARGVLLSKRIVLLNERGLPVQGVIYDGQDAMVGSVRFAYDALGRMQEEISLNAQGQIFRRRIQQYDQSGKPLPVKIVDYAANTPASGASKIDFTGVTPAPGTTAAPQAPKQPGDAPQIQTVNPRAKPEEKKGFFKKIFGK